MKPDVRILSRKAAEELIAGTFPKNAAVISFYDPETRSASSEYKPVDYSSVCGNVFQVCIHDIDIESLEDFGLSFDTYFPEAEALADFIIDSVKDGRSIICQCEYGQSRSAACAAAILEAFDNSGIEIFADYRYYPNQLIFNKLRKTLGERFQNMPDDNIGGKFTAVGTGCFD